MKVSMRLDEMVYKKIKLKKYEKENENITDTTCYKVDKHQDFVVVGGGGVYCLKVRFCLLNTTERFSLYNKCTCSVYFEVFNGR